MPSKHWGTGAIIWLFSTSIYWACTTSIHKASTTIFKTIETVQWFSKLLVYFKNGLILFVTRPCWLPWKVGMFFEFCGNICLKMRGVKERNPILARQSTFFDCWTLTDNFYLVSWCGGISPSSDEFHFSQWLRRLKCICKLFILIICLNGQSPLFVFSPGSLFP